LLAAFADYDPALLRRALLGEAGSGAAGRDLLADAIECAEDESGGVAVSYPVNLGAATTTGGAVVVVVGVGNVLVTVTSALDETRQPSARHPTGKVTTAGAELGPLAAPGHPEGFGICGETREATAVSENAQEYAADVAPPVPVSVTVQVSPARAGSCFCQTPPLGAQPVGAFAVSGVPSARNGNSTVAMLSAPHSTLTVNPAVEVPDTTFLTWRIGVVGGTPAPAVPASPSPHTPASSMSATNAPTTRLIRLHPP
jgi:hypothetical protein